MLYYYTVMNKKCEWMWMVSLNRYVRKQPWCLKVMAWGDKENHVHVVWETLFTPAFVPRKLTSHREATGPYSWDIESHSRVVNTPDSYSGSPGFKSRPGYRLPWLRFPWFSSVPPGEFRDSTLTLGHDRFLPNPSQFIVHLSPFHSTLHSATCWQSSLNEPQIRKYTAKLK
jgi:hypothetical protein